MDNDLLSSTQKIGIIKPLRVSVSGIDVRKEVVDKLESLNLDYSAQFDRDCSFLVASSVVSDKYRAAAEWGIPIVKPKWITQSYNGGELLDWRLFKLEPFAGLFITLSGLHENDERIEIRKLIESNGGEHLGELVGDKTTHLITRTPSGMKYEAAKEWKIKILHPSWVRDSVKNGICMPHQPYVIDQSSSTSSNARNSKPINLIAANKPQQSPHSADFIEEIGIAPSKIVSVSKKEAEYKPVPLTISQKINTQETPLQQMTQESYVPMQNIASSSSSLKRPRDSQTITIEENKENENDEKEKKYFEELSKNSSTMTTLNNCIIYIPSFNQQRRNFGNSSQRDLIVSKLVLFLGGFVINELCPITTHVIALDYSKDAMNSLETIERMMPGLLIVKIEWLYQCIERKRRVRESEYLVFSTNDVNDNKSLSRERKRNKSLTEHSKYRGKYICVSGYVGDERKEVEDIVINIGGIYTERLTSEYPKISLLVCKGTTGLKYEKAIEWGVEIQDIEWLRNYLNQLKSEGGISVKVNANES